MPGAYSPDFRPTRTQRITGGLTKGLVRRKTLLQVGPNKTQVSWDWIPAPKVPAKKPSVAPKTTTVKTGPVIMGSSSNNIHSVSPAQPAKKLPVKTATTTTKTATTNTSPVDNDLMKQAQQQISVQLDPQLADLAQQIKDAQTSGASQTSDLNELYGRLANFVSASRIPADLQAAQTQQQIGSNFDQLQQKLQDIYGGANQQTAGELQRLGIGSVQDAATKNMQSDQKNLEGLAAINRTNQLATSGTVKDNFDNLVDIISGQARLQGANKVAATMTTMNKLVGDLSAKKGALSATRKAAVQTLYNQMLNAKTQREADAAQQRFMNSIAAAKVGISQGELGVKQGELGVKQGQLSLAAQKEQRAAAKQQADSALDQALKLSRIRLNNSTYVKNMRGPAAAQAKGYTGGLSFLQQSPLGKDAAAQAHMGTAQSLYRYYSGKYGKDALYHIYHWGNGKGDPHFNALPAQVKNALIDALGIAGYNTNPTAPK